MLSSTMLPSRPSTLLALVLPCSLLAMLLLGGCGLLLDVDPRPDASGPANGDTPPRDCDYFVFIDGAGSGDAMDDANRDLVATALRAGAEGGGVVCAASRGVPGDCEATTYNGAVTIGRGVTLQGGFRAGQQPWAWDPACKPIVAGRAPAWAAVTFTAEADSTSALTYMRVNSPRDLEATAGVQFSGGGTIANCQIRATASGWSVGVLGNGPGAGAGQPIAIIDTDVSVANASMAMAAVSVTGHPTTITGSFLNTIGPAADNAGITLLNAAGSRIADGNRIVVGPADTVAAAAPARSRAGAAARSRTPAPARRRALLLPLTGAIVSAAAGGVQ